MIKSITVTNYLGDSIVLELGRPEESGLLIKNITGIGAPKADINTTEISTNDGSLFNSSRLEKRNIVFTIAFLFKETIEDARQLTYKYFPIKKNVTLLFETDNRICSIVGYVEKNDPGVFSKAESTQISIICPDPYFYSNALQTTIFYGVEPMFEFPFENNSTTDKLIELGTIRNETERYVNYNGDSEIGLQIKIHAIGEASGISIYNIKTREEMDIDTDKLIALTGKGLIASDDIIINTFTGMKSVTLVREGVSTNILNCLSRNPSWFRLTKGDNVFAYTAKTGEANLQFRIENKIIYEGI